MGGDKIHLLFVGWSSAYGEGLYVYIILLGPFRTFSSTGSAKQILYPQKKRYIYVYCFFFFASLLYMRRVYIYIYIFIIFRTFQTIFFYRICEADPFSTKGTCFLYEKLKPENYFGKKNVEKLPKVFFIFFRLAILEKQNSNTFMGLKPDARYPSGGQKSVMS